MILPASFVLTALMVQPVFAFQPYPLSIPVMAKADAIQAVCQPRPEGQGYADYRLYDMASANQAS